LTPIEAVDRLTVAPEPEEAKEASPLGPLSGAALRPVGTSLTSLLTLMRENLSSTMGVGYIDSQRGK